MGVLRDEVATDPKYRLCLNEGFVGVQEWMGDDAAIVQAARVSYGKGTRSVREDRGLIRYLLRHAHTTPFEMCEIKFRVRAPIFVVRQWFRHRTANVNEESARYSEMLDEFYFPADEDIQPQSDDNKQGRAGELSNKDRKGVNWLLNASHEHSFDIYNVLLGKRAEEVGKDLIYDPYGNIDPLLNDEYPGIARELARVVMPLSTYTTFIWKQNLHNLFHFIKLRADPHAQKEIRVYAEAMLDLIRPLYPIAIEAFEDYVQNAMKLSRMEIALTKALLAPQTELLLARIEAAGGEKAFAEAHGMSPRELREWRGRMGV